MAKTSITNLDSQLTTLFPDGGNKGITASNVRSHQGDVHDSFVHLDESKYQRQAGDAAGSANAITVSIDYPAAYTANIPIRFTATATNTGAFTFKVNSLAALNVYDTGGNQLTTAGNITSGQIYEVEWSTAADGGTTDGFILTKSGSTTAASGQFDDITDQAGTGPPDFSQGLTVAGGDTFDFFDGSSKAADNDFSAGTVYYRRVGDVVTISFTSLTHTSASSAETSSGFLPANFRPSQEETNIYAQSSSLVREVTVETDGTISMQYRDWAGSTTSAGATAIGNISFVKF